MFGNFFGGGSGPVATGMQTSDLLKIGSNGNFAFQPQDNREMMGKLFSQGMNNAQNSVTPAQYQTPRKREYQPFAVQQPSDFVVQDKPTAPPDIAALVAALRNGG